MYDLGALPDSVTARLDDALLVIDVQRDFMPGGTLAVPHGDAVVMPLNRYLRYWMDRGLATFATRCWHPPDHCSFAAQGGPWPPHCVAGTPGAAFATGLALPETTVVVSKGERSERDAYSGFEGTDLDRRLRAAGIRRVFVGGVATDFCVRASVKDALAAGYSTVVLADAVRAIDAHPGDGHAAEAEMRARGATFVSLDRFTSY